LWPGANARSGHAGYRNDSNHDFEEIREIIRKIHFFARQGRRWEPEGKKNINHVRRSFLKLKPDYIVEFIWIMAGYKKCQREDLEALVASFRYLPLSWREGVEGW